jgi:NMD protein affecting ribosome stability and mRNA decay
LKKGRSDYLSSKFCPKCGATDKDFYKGFCVDCYLESHELVQFPKKIEIPECTHCGMWLYHNKWVEDSYQHLQKIVADKVKTDLVDPEYEAEILEKKDKKIRVKVVGYLDKQRQFRLEREARIPFSKDGRICRACVKFSDKYYEVKLQLRNAETTDLVLYKKASTFIRRNAHALARSDQRAKAFWWEERREGTDFFFGFKQIGDAVVSETKKKFKVKVEKSSRFLGYSKDGKKKVRFTYCIRI